MKQQIAPTPVAITNVQHFFIYHLLAIPSIAVTIHMVTGYIKHCSTHLQYLHCYCKLAFSGPEISDGHEFPYLYIYAVQKV